MTVKRGTMSEEEVLERVRIQGTNLKSHADREKLAAFFRTQDAGYWPSKRLLDEGYVWPPKQDQSAIEQKEDKCPIPTK
jgi:hypothetical protein